jgi:hypothetical protein
MILASFFILYSPSTGLTIPSGGPKGYPYQQEPLDLPPKLFRRESHAKGWLSNWKKGYRVDAHEEFDDDGMYFAVPEKWIPVHGRAESDLQVRQVTISLI